MKDEEAFRALMARVYGTEDGVELWEGEDKAGNTVFAFGCYGAIAGLRYAKEDEDDEEDIETAFEEFIDKLQKCVADDDAIIILESGHEKLRYVYGDYTVITSKHMYSNNMTNAAVQEAKKCLNNPAWETETWY